MTVGHLLQPLALGGARGYRAGGGNGQGRPMWGFALYYAGSDRYEDSRLPTGTPAEALDCACQLHLAAPGI